MKSWDYSKVFSYVKETLYSCAIMLLVDIIRTGEEFKTVYFTNTEYWPLKA
jgi:hypothetical protein